MAVCGGCSGRTEGALFWGIDGQPFLGTSPCHRSAELVSEADELGLLWARHASAIGLDYLSALDALRGRQVCLVESVELCGGIAAVGCASSMGEGVWVAESSPRGPLDWSAALVHELGHVLEARAGITNVQRLLLEPLVEHAHRSCQD